MRKNIRKSAQKIASLVKHVKLNTILPFTEKPSSETELDANNHAAPRDNNIAASELFSLFTANIIKEEVVFTR